MNRSTIDIMKEKYDAVLYENTCLKMQIAYLMAKQKNNIDIDIKKNIRKPITKTNTVPTLKDLFD